MQNFVFHNPTKIIFGRGTIDAIGEETRVLGRRVLLVYGRASIKASGLYDQVLSSLGQAGLSVIEHGGVRSNPVLSHVRAGIDKARRERIDVIVAVGGGSVIDSAKAISAGALVNHDVWKFFTGKKSIRQALPVTTVLTLAAAGSEMNSGMVITNEETGEKFGTGNRLLHPRVSILDPETTYTVPPDYTAYGAVDAVAHVLEFYMTAADQDTPVQARIMEGLIENAMDSCNRCLANPRDYNARADLMWTATLALNGLTGAGLGRIGFPMHMIEHSLSALYDIPHGAGLSIVIPGWLRWFARRDTARIARLARRVFPPTDLALYTDEHMANRAITMLHNWFGRINSPTSLEEAEIPRQDIPAIAANALKLARVWQLREYSQETIEEILELCG